MNESRDYLGMTFRSIECFANDGKLDVIELGKILEIAESDGKIDANEARVLNNIISRLKPSELDSGMKEKVSEIKKKLASFA